MVLDPGMGGISGPLNFAYDPARLEVTASKVATCRRSGEPGFQVTHTPALGWITASWSGKASAVAPCCA